MTLTLQEKIRVVRKYGEREHQALCDDLLIQLAREFDRHMDEVGVLLGAFDQEVWREIQGQVHPEEILGVLKS